MLVEGWHVRGSDVGQSVGFSFKTRLDQVASSAGNFDRHCSTIGSALSCPDRGKTPVTQSVAEFESRHLGRRLRSLERTAGSRRDTAIVRTDTTNIEPAMAARTARHSTTVYVMRGTERIAANRPAGYLPIICAIALPRWIDATALSSHIGRAVVEKSPIPVAYESADI